MELTFTTDYTPVIYDEAFECAKTAICEKLSYTGDAWDDLRREIALQMLAIWHSDPETLIAAECKDFGIASPSMQALLLYSVALKDADSIIATIEKWGADAGRFAWRTPKGKKLDAFMADLTANYTAAQANR